jgi:type VI secretion system secreted protein Hcp
MKQKFFYKTTVLLAFTLLSVSSSVAQKQFTVTSSKENNYCNGTCTLFNNADLNGNPTAVIFVTAVEVNGVNLDPHPICAYYNGKQWSVMNTDNSTMPAGAQFKVEYYVAADEKNFVHIVSKENQVKNNSYIDHAGLNGNPKASFRFFQNASPNIRGGLVNSEEAKFLYDENAGKWFVSNTKGKTMDIATGYNISISSEIKNDPVTTAPANIIPFVPGAKVDNSGQRVFVTVLGKIQGQFAGENNTARMEVTGFEMQVNSPRDLATGQATGKRQHPPVMFQKNIGPASVQFYKASATNELLTTITLEVYKPSASGTSVLDYKIILTNATITSFKQSLIDGSKGFTDTIMVTAQKFDLISGNLMASDSINNTL